MLEEPGLIFNDLVGNAMIVHPLPEDRDEPARVRLLGHRGQQRHLRDFAAPTSSMIIAVELVPAPHAATTGARLPALMRPSPANGRAMAADGS
ncbi:hypothetical protein RLDS_12145 [Sphingobium lactosutens DS20]|uniref:Uncharacterized protein n=1 Tax=Sphingobium lactosutens DS20 TaxID=1331060 RepID=T0IZ20_9SPHN|nr:hypothetical protein RLDS_12145 [Sphingobium lactosutens DS20]